VDGKALSGSAHRQRHRRHPLAADTHLPTITLAQQEAGGGSQDQRDGRLPPATGSTRSAGAIAAPDAPDAPDAPHSVKDQAHWLMQEKKTHYIAVIKENQPTTSAQVKALPWEQEPVTHNASGAGHRAAGAARGGGSPARSKPWPSRRTWAASPSPMPGRRCASTGAARRAASDRPGRRSTPSPASTPTRPAPLTPGRYGRGHGRTENCGHPVKDVVAAEDAPSVHTGNAPRAMAALPNLATGRPRPPGADNIPKTTRAIRDTPEHALWIRDITDNPPLPGT
jgi:hypothetical protein